MRRAVPIALVALAAGVIIPLVVLTYTRGSQLQNVSGVLIDVQASSLVNAERITLRDEHGHVLTFQVDPEALSNPDTPQTASLLHQHMALAEPMIVHYRQSPSGPVAVRIVDGDH
jgi:hypothetical protein